MSREQAFARAFANLLVSVRLNDVTLYAFPRLLRLAGAQYPREEAALRTRVW